MEQNIIIAAESTADLSPTLKTSKNDRGAKVLPTFCRPGNND